MNKYSKKLKITNNLKDNAKKNENNSTNKEKTKRTKPIIKIAIFSLYLASIATLTTLGLKFGYYYGAKYSGMLDFDELTYITNPNITPGYYNSHPVTICISNKFNNLWQKQIIEGIKELDKNALGIKFDYSIGDTDCSNSDIKIVSHNYNGSKHGFTHLGHMDAKKIEGTIKIDNSLFTLGEIKATTIHELCHVIGLDHSKQLDSIVFPIVTSNKMTKQDIDNINTIYPER